MSTTAASDLDPRTDELADRIIASYEGNDAEGYLGVFAPGARVWLSYLDDDMSAEQNAALLTQIFSSFVEEFRYDDMRREKTSTGYVQRSRLTIVAKSGARFSTPVCTLARIDEQGRVEQLSEYLDSGILTFGQEQASATTTAVGVSTS